MFICFEFECANYIFLFFNLKCNTLVQVNKPRGIAFQTFNTYFQLSLILPNIKTFYQQLLTFIFAIGKYTSFPLRFSKK